MNDKIISMLVGILIMLGGWTLAKTFGLSTNQAVQMDKVAKLERHVEKLQDKMDDMMDADEEIQRQHKKLFEVIEDNNNNNTGSTGTYNY
tara:strand:+ start:187 stop:456 length:270 start_codon:yes stop_codon:yes gene_type:complete